MDRLMVSVSGVRGTVGGTLTPQVAFDFGCAFATMLAGEEPGAAKTVALGRDTRPSGPMIETAVTDGLRKCGVNVISLGVVTTPGVALMTRLLGCDGGIIITASHNPLPYNGIKFLQPSGVGLPAKQAGRLKKIWEAGTFDLQADADIGTKTENDTTHDEHIRAVKDITDVATIIPKRFKVVLDSINGAGCIVTPMLLADLGCEVVPLNAEPTGDFAHPPEPIEANLSGLCEAMRQHGAAVGFAQDPDADRLVLVDETGTFIGEEYTLALAAAFVLRHRKGKLAANLVTSRMIDDLAADAGVDVVRSPTGEANVVEALLANECIFGGEGNGGVIDPRVVPVRDSLVGMAMILQDLAETGESLSTLVAKIPAYTMRKVKMPCPTDAADKVADRVRKTFADRPGAAFNDADGLRIDLPGAWVSVRASNTEPILRIFSEAADASSADALLAEVRAIAEDIVG